LLNIILVATGGATGAILRYILTNFSKTLFTSSIYGTLTVNVIGCFLIGYLVTSDFSKNINENFVKFFLIIGLLGSFTTFSAFSYEVVNLIISNKIFIALIYIFISIFISILFAYFGMLINKF
jgi:CrcB protein|tara:strand:+ start:169 stop:537 length:369 start_codon:yes stop_codon:yes gene_type:complete